jgi:hypothetical protein
MQGCQQPASGSQLLASFSPLPAADARSARSVPGARAAARPSGAAAARPKPHSPWLSCSAPWLRPPRPRQTLSPYAARALVRTSTPSPVRSSRHRAVRARRTGIACCARDGMSAAPRRSTRHAANAASTPHRQWLAMHTAVLVRVACCCDVTYDQLPESSCCTATVPTASSSPTHERGDARPAADFAATCLAALLTVD